jgi:hypothetical protein
MSIATFFVINDSPNEQTYEGVLAMRASANGLSLSFNHGTELSDPAKSLQESCNQTRSNNAEGASTLTRHDVARRIDEAIAHNPVRFARLARLRKLSVDATCRVTRAGMSEVPSKVQVDFWT